MADATPLITVFCIVLEVNVFGLTFLLYYPRSLVTSLLFPLLLFFFFCWPAISAKRSAIVRFIIKTIISGVWFFRNKSTFRNVKDNYHALIRLRVAIP